jgi:glycosyltransferase involved in cell wall biosynthesis
MQAVTALTDLIRRHSIAVVHLHPYYTALPGYLAAAQARVPYVCSIHGTYDFEVQHRLQGLLLRQLVWPAAGFVACVGSGPAALASSQALGRFVVIPNAVRKRAAASAEIMHDTWAAAARFDQHKVRGIAQFLRMAAQVGIKKVELFGDGPRKQALARFCAERCPEVAVRFMGWDHDAAEMFGRHAGVAGMARIALEAASSNRPVLLVGYDGPKGLLTRDNVARAAAGNFAGIGFKVVTVEELRGQLEDLAAHPDRFELQSWVEEHHSEERVWGRFEALLGTVHAPDPAPSGFLIDCLQMLWDEKGSVYDHQGLESLLTGFVELRSGRSPPHSIPSLSGMWGSKAPSPRRQ